MRTVLLSLAIVASSDACGVGVHTLLTNRVLPYFPSDVAENPSQVFAGAFFPDAFYSCMGLSDAAEDAHWPPFLKVGVEYWREKYGHEHDSEAVPSMSWWTRLSQSILRRPNDIQVSARSSDGNKLRAFLFGVLGHQVADVSWHSLGVYQGLLRAMAEMEFHGDTSKSHSVLDTGGDMIMVHRLLASGLDLDLLRNMKWDYPTDDIIEIFHRMGYTAYRAGLDYCMLRGRAGLAAELQVANAGYASYSRQSPILFSHLEDYYLGGTVELTMAIRHCLSGLQGWFDHGTPEDAWTLCEVFGGKRPKKIQCVHAEIDPVQTEVVEIEAVEIEAAKIEAAKIEAAKIETLHTLEPTILRSKQPQSLFGASLALGNFLQSSTRPALAVAAPFEADDAGNPSGSVYVMDLGEVDSLSMPMDSAMQLQTIKPHKLPSYTFNERFGSQVVKLRVLDQDILVLSRPGLSIIEFFIGSSNVLQLNSKVATTAYGSRGVKLLGETLYVGDVTGDGTDDLLIGAPRTDVGGQQQQGQVFVLTAKTLENLVRVAVRSKQSPRVFDLMAASDKILNYPKLAMSYALFGSRLQSIRGLDGKTYLLVGAQGEGIVYGYTGDMTTPAFSLQGDDYSRHSEFGGAILKSAANGTIVVSSSSDRVDDCEQCGRVYVYRIEKTSHVGLVARLSSPEHQAFSRFGSVGTVVDDRYLLVSSPHAQHEAGSVWLTDLQPDELTVRTIVDKGPRPYAGGFGSSIAGLVSNKLTLAVGMPYYGDTLDDTLSGAVAVYDIDLTDFI